MRRHAIVVGASSGIGAALAQRLAREGFDLALLARRQDRLEAQRAEIAAIAPEARVLLRTHDVRDPSPVEPLLAELAAELGGLDLLIYAAGVMPDVPPTGFDTAIDRGILEVNVLGAVAWLNAGAARFESAGRGTLVGISSVAGERGRRKFPVYAASKAALTAYLEGLRNRLATRGVQVVTIKPGPVDTEMLGGNRQQPMLIPADAAADAIFSAIASGGSVTRYVPWQWAPIMAAIRSVPSVIFRRLNV